MSNYGKVLLSMGLLSLLSVSPLTAQFGNGMKFTTPFPFYVGQTKMPPGSYTLTEPEDLDFHMIIVRSTDDLHAASTWVIGMQSSQPPRRSVVVFEKYGDTLYLDKVLIDGDTSGVLVAPTKAEKKAEENASVAEQRSIVASGQ
jgi:hypothetical protein